jgi:CubicO group peptidase (beta-lactamase class C family)
MRTRTAGLGCLIALCLGPTIRAWSLSPAALLTVGQNFVDALAAYMNTRVEADAFSGAVLVREQYRPLFSYSSGWADRERGDLNRLDTRFNIGSIGKSFTAAAIMQMAEEGKLSVTDTIGQHLPNYPRPAADTITIHHLLTHRSGLPASFVNDRFWALKDSLRLNRDYLQLFIDQPLAFEPGTMTLYSNPGYVVLGAIIERVSGEEYSAYVRRHIYEPAGMNQTDWPTGDPRKIAVGYTFFNAPPTGERERIEQLHGAQASGAQQSTVRDLIQFALALQAGRLMSPVSVELMTTGKESMEASGPPVIAYGFLDRRVNGARIIENSGGAPGINAVLSFQPQSGYAVAVLANYDPPAATDVARAIERLLVACLEEIACRQGYIGGSDLAALAQQMGSSIWPVFSPRARAGGVIVPVTPADLPEVLVIEHDVIRHSRGFFLETYHFEKYAACGINSSVCRQFEPNDEAECVYRSFWTRRVRDSRQQNHFARFLSRSRLCADSRIVQAGHSE